jgi:hypothetical protein
MSVLKVVQNVAAVSCTGGNAAQSSAVIVNSGIYRFTADASDAIHVAWGGNPTAVEGNDFHIPKESSELVKCASPKRGQITAITTGASNTVITCAQDGRTPSHPFVVGDYVTCTGSSVAAYDSGIAHLAVTAVTDTTITVALNSSGYAAFTGTATLSNSIKFSVKPDGNGAATGHITEVQIVGG